MLRRILSQKATKIHGVTFRKTLNLVLTNSSKCRCFRLLVYIRRPNSRNLAWDSFLTPFTRGIWIATAACVVLTAASLMLVDKLWMGRRCGLERRKICLHILQVVQFSLGAFCLQGFGFPILLRSLTFWHLNYSTPVCKCE
jgi:hypothetical protein